MDTNLLFWNASVDEIKKGYKLLPEDNIFICLICGETFEPGVIYKMEDKLVEAEKMVKYHIEKQHSGVFQYLIHLNKKYTGLSENQTEVLSLIKSGLTDFEISKKLKISQSTVRNYRFKFREKEKQAKIFSAIMELLKPMQNSTETEIMEVHKGASMIDERFDITEAERKNILSRYMDSSGKLIDFPGKEKRKIIILSEISKNFKKDTDYTEKEINRILERIYPDYVVLRRYLIEYGYLDRSRDGSRYWVKL
jgi:hypothetical protein